MNKKEASEYLGVSTKAIERYTKAGKLTAKYKRKPTGGTEAIYNDEQIKKLKADMEKAKEAPVQIERRRTSAGQDSQNLVWVSKITDIAREIMATIQSTRASVPVANKLVLTLAQAAELAGIPESVLADAIKTDQLSARTIAGAVMVRRVDVEKFIDNLWKSQTVKKAPPVKSGRPPLKKKASRRR